MRAPSFFFLGFILLVLGMAAAQEKPLMSFSGELAAGQSYSHEVPTRMLFSLVPITGGWSAAVSGAGGCGNLANITEPATSLQVVLPTPPGPSAQPSSQLPAPNRVSYALSCNDYALFIKSNACRAEGKRLCTDMGAVAAGRIVLTVTSFVPQRRSYNQPAAYQSIKFTVDVFEPSPSGAN